MKLETTILLRRDGTVRAVVESETYVFAPEDGVLVCDVENDAHAAYLLGLGDYIPADEEDFQRAAAMTAKAVNDPQDDDDDDEDDDEAPNMNAAPIEEPASVVAAPAPARGAKKKAAK